MTYFGVRPAGWLSDEPAGQVAEIVEWAVHAEELGFDVVYVGDRLLAGAKSADEVQVYEATMLDPIVMLTAMAARTKRIRLATLVAIVPFRHPASFAKLTASLDVVSNGRFILGAGSGWSAPELALFSLPREKRGIALEEGIALLRKFWTGESVSSDGFWKFEEVRVTPVPVQKPGPPIWLASGAPEDLLTWDGTFASGQQKVLNRIGRIADGWAPVTYSAKHKMQLPAEQLARSWDIIAAAAVDAGRNPDDIDILYPHWMAVVRDDAERRKVEETLERYFTGDYESARQTYLIGTPDEIVAQVAEQTSGLPRVDGYLFTQLSDDPEQLDIVASEIRPRLAALRS